MAHAEQKVLYLTFDDGPSERYTPKILDILHRERVHATFFVLGFRCKQYPIITKRIHREGHEIGNHGFYHQQIVNKDNAWLRRDVLKTDQIIHRICGVQTMYYRPPGGLISDTELTEIRKTGHHVMLWTVDSQDWKTNSTQSILRNVYREVKPGSVILLHDGVTNSQFTVKALPILIRTLKFQGYVFKVLPQ